jgi:DNA-binding NarL/FixJ family response regulator
MLSIGSPGPTVRIVLVEDHDDLRQQLCIFLEEHGGNVVGSACNTTAGRETILREKPDFAVVDNYLPDGRGTDLCADVRHEEPGIRVVIHSGTVTSDDLARAEQAGATAVVPKSVRGLELLEALGLAGPGAVS